jgi:hypothetical protein
MSSKKSHHSGRTRRLLVRASGASDKKGIRKRERKERKRTRSDNNWGAVAALVTGFTQRQCYNRWHDLAETIIDRASAEASRGLANDQSTSRQDGRQSRLRILVVLNRSKRSGHNVF